MVPNRLEISQKHTDVNGFITGNMCHYNTGIYMAHNNKTKNSELIVGPDSAS